MWLFECQPLNRNRIWHTCTQLKKCELPHRVFDLNVTCHQEKAWSNISRAIIKCYNNCVSFIDTVCHHLFILNAWLLKFTERQRCHKQASSEGFCFSVCSSYKKVSTRYVWRCSSASSTASHFPADLKLKADSTSHTQGLNSRKQTWTEENKFA